MIAWIKWAIGRVGYAVRPYDMLADSRRWFWQPRTPCHSVVAAAQCSARAGPVWKLDGEICGCVLRADHEGWHECSCNAQWCVP